MHACWYDLPPAPLVQANLRLRAVSVMLANLTVIDWHALIELGLSPWAIRYREKNKSARLALPGSARELPCVVENVAVKAFRSPMFPLAQISRPQRIQAE